MSLPPSNRNLTLPFTHVLLRPQPPSSSSPLQRLTFLSIVPSSLTSKPFRLSIRPEYYYKSFDHSLVPTIILIYRRGAVRSNSLTKQQSIQHCRRSIRRRTPPASCLRKNSRKYDKSPEAGILDKIRIEVDIAQLTLSTSDWNSLCQPPSSTPTWSNGSQLQISHDGDPKPAFQTAIFRQDFIISSVIQR